MRREASLPWSEALLCRRNEDASLLLAVAARVLLWAARFLFRLSSLCALVSLPNVTADGALLVRVAAVE